MSSQGVWIYSKLNGKILKDSAILNGHTINHPVVPSSSMKCKDFSIC